MGQQPFVLVSFFLSLTHSLFFSLSLSLPLSFCPSRASSFLSSSYLFSFSEKRNGTTTHQALRPTTTTQSTLVCSVRSEVTSQPCKLVGVPISFAGLTVPPLVCKCSPCCGKLMTSRFSPFAVSNRDCNKPRSTWTSKVYKVIAQCL